MKEETVTTNELMKLFKEHTARLMRQAQTCKDISPQMVEAICGNMQLILEAEEII